MKNILVVYKSKYGFTKKYAEWIAAELNASLFDAEIIKPAQLMTYDVVIYGGGLYDGGISGVKLITKNPCKTLVIFTVGAADPQNTDYSKILSKNFTQEFLSKIRIFHLQGGIDYSKLGLTHKVMMSLAKKFKVENNPDLRSDEDKLFMEIYGAKFDYTDKSTIKPITDYVLAL